MTAFPWSVERSKLPHWWIPISPRKHKTWVSFFFSLRREGISLWLFRSTHVLLQIFAGRTALWRRVGTRVSPCLRHPTHPRASWGGQPSTLPCESQRQPNAQSAVAHQWQHHWKREFQEKRVTGDTDVQTGDTSLCLVNRWWKIEDTPRCR